MRRTRVLSCVWIDFVLECPFFADNDKIKSILSVRRHNNKAKHYISDMKEHVYRWLLNSNPKHKLAKLGRC